MQIVKNIISSHSSYFIRHVLVGGASAVLNYSLFTLLFNYFHVSVYISNIVTYAVAVVITYILQKFYTYRDRKPSFVQPLMFLSLSIAYSILDSFIIDLLLTHTAVISYLCKFISLSILLPISFIIQRLFIFKQKEE